MKKLPVFLLIIPILFLFGCRNKQDEDIDNLRQYIASVSSDIVSTDTKGLFLILRPYFEDEFCPEVNTTSPQAKLNNYPRQALIADHVIEEWKRIVDVKNFDFVDPWDNPYRFKLWQKDENASVYLTIYSPGPPDCILPNGSLDTSKSFCSKVITEHSYQDRVTCSFAINEQEKEAMLAKKKREKEEKEKREREKRYKKSPRGRCESSCNATYASGTNSWRICMTACSDMRTD